MWNSYTVLIETIFRMNQRVEPNWIIYDIKFYLVCFDFFWLHQKYFATICGHGEGEISWNMKMTT